MEYMLSYADRKGAVRSGNVVRSTVPCFSVGYNDVHPVVRPIIARATCSLFWRKKVDGFVADNNAFQGCFFLLWVMKHLL